MRTLLVDDDELCLTLLQNALREMGYPYPRLMWPAFNEMTRWNNS